MAAINISKYVNNGNILYIEKVFLGMLVNKVYKNNLIFLNILAYNNK
jgi:hypothetical protein